MVGPRARKRLGWIAFAVSAVACSNLDGLTGAPPGSDGGADGSASDAGGGDAIAAGDAPSDGPFLADGGDAGGQTDGAACTDPCDCDGDLYKNDKPGCAKGTEKVDCDDLDSRIRPDQGFLDFTPPASAPKPGDWNCDGLVTKLYPTNAVCSMGNCASQSGFSGDPACGAIGDYVTCGPTGINLCEVKTTEKRKQACR